MSDPSDITPYTCVHGGLNRKCDLCSLEAENATLRAQVAELEQRDQGYEPWRRITTKLQEQLARAKAALSEEQVGPLWDRWLERIGQGGSEPWSTPQMIEFFMTDRRRAAFGEEGGTDR